MAFKYLPPLLLTRARRTICFISSYYVTGVFIMSAKRCQSEKKREKCKQNKTNPQNKPTLLISNALNTAQKSHL